MKTAARPILLLALLLGTVSACDRGQDEVMNPDPGSAGEKGTISDAMLDTDTATDEAPLDPMALPALPKVDTADEGEQTVETAEVGDEPIPSPGLSENPAERADSSDR